MNNTQGNPNNHMALIMAGGQGKRFWPYSTEQKPKQFLNIVGDLSLITQTFNRLKRFIRAENIYVVADRIYLSLIQSCIPGFKEDNFVSEPMPKNTAPCLMLANLALSKKNPDANLVVVPADHYIPDEEVFARQIGTALDFADQKCIITSGIQPDSPHTGYGYINFDKEGPDQLKGQDFFAVRSFREKPKLEVAKGYVADGRYFWNSGIFIYKLRYFVDFLKDYAPYYHQKYLELEAAPDSDSFGSIFRGIEPQSIDYALMEKVKEVKMFKAAYFWSDVGAWSSVYELGEKDSDGNVNLAEKGVFIDSGNSMIFSRGEVKPISLIGLENVVVVNTPEGILVSHIDSLQKVKEVLDKI